MTKNVVFIGASGFGLKCLQTLLAIPEIKVCGAVTAPRTFSISYNKQGVTNVLHADVKAVCDDYAIPCLEIQDGMKGDGLFESVSAWKPDFFIVCGWYHMLPKRWMDMAPAYGLHASLLPRYSGGAPLVWAIINGEKETGISFFQFDQGVDSGLIVGQASTEIAENDTIATLYARIENLGVDLVRTHVPKLALGTAELKQQDEKDRSVFPQRAPADGRIDWQWDARRIYDFIRAQTKPYPGAFTIANGAKLSIWNAAPVSQPNPATPGKLYVAANDVCVGCGNGSSIRLLSLSVNDVDVSMDEAVAFLKEQGGFDG